MGESALEKFVAEAQGLSGEFESSTVFSIGGWHISQYTCYMFLALLVVFLIVLVGGRRLRLIPDSKFLNTLEYGYGFVRNSIAENVIGKGFERHVPFLATLFFFILIANFIGLIPGAKAMAGTISVTWALSCISFVYFIYWGLRELKLWGYIKSLVPAGLPKPMIPIIWILELFSTVIRVLTLAVRLYGNMLAGHMVLAVFSIATSIFLTTAIAQMSLITGLPAIAWFALLLVMYALETLVAFLQAYVFTILSASYVGMAIHPH